MDTTKLRVGVIGAASIAKKNIRAIAQSKNCVIAGLASRSVEKAKTFLNDLGLSFDVKIFASYESIITSTEIDALYIPLPTVLHVEWAKKAAAAGKHILIEKPVALNLNDLQDIIKACHANNCCYMDGVMFMHHRRTAMLGDLLRDPLVSEVQRVSASFSFNAHEEFFKSNIRASSQGDPLGCLGDLGWYCIRIGLFAFNKGQFADAKSIILPKRCTARCLKWTEDGVPLQVDAHISFSEEGWARELVFDNSFISAFRQRYELVCSSRTLSRGDKVVTCDDFVIPRCQKSASFQVETFPNGGSPLADHATRVMSHRDVVECSGTEPSFQQEAAMFDEFARVIKARRAGDKFADQYWINVSLATQVVLDACFVSMKCDGGEVMIPQNIFSEYPADCIIS